jgi:hypothetical protein
MISRPTTAQLIDATCVELETKVAPAVTDQAVKVVLDMAVAVLRSASVRCANELAWMREEADSIEEVARRLIAELRGSAALADALRAYTDDRTDSRYLHDAIADYGRVSEVLSRAAEAAYAAGDAEHRAAVMRLFQHRMAHENAITGGFEAVGRT